MDSRLGTCGLPACPPRTWGWGPEGGHRAAGGEGTDASPSGLIPGPWPCSETGRTAMSPRGRGKRMGGRAPEELSSSLPWEPVRRAKSRAPPQTFRISNGLRGPSRLRLNRPGDLDAGDHSRTTTSTSPTVPAREHGLGSPLAPPGSAPHRPNQNPWGENRYRLHFKFPRGLRRSTGSAGHCARAPLAQGNCHLGPILNSAW